MVTHCIVFSAVADPICKTRGCGKIATCGEYCESCSDYVRRPPETAFMRYLDLFVTLVGLLFTGFAAGVFISFIFKCVLSWIRWV